MKKRLPYAILLGVTYGVAVAVAMSEELSGPILIVSFVGIVFAELAFHTAWELAVKQNDKKQS